MCGGSETDGEWCRRPLRQRQQQQQILRYRENVRGKRVVHLSLKNGQEMDAVNIEGMVFVFVS